MRTMRVYEAIVKGIEGLGVEAAFGGAGENAASLMLALKHSVRIRPVITRHEQAASFMACGYAMWTAKLGFCFATAEPGAFTLFSGLAVAMSDSYPVLAVTGYASLDWKGRGAPSTRPRARPARRTPRRCSPPRPRAPSCSRTSPTPATCSSGR